MIANNRKTETIQVI